MATYKIWRGPANNLKPLVVYKSNGVRVSSLHGGTTTPGQPQTLTYSRDDVTDFLNPERGWMDRRARQDSRFANARSTTGDPYNTAYTVIWTETFGTPWNGSPGGNPFRLDNYKNSSLPQSLLDELPNWFQAARTAGIKLKIRFMYNYDENGTDTTLVRMQEHIQQLAPVINANRDVIAIMDAGFWGRWGEWNGQWDSQNGIQLHLRATSASTTPWWQEPWKSARRALMQTLLDEIHPDIMIGMRNPRADQGIREKFPDWQMDLDDRFDASQQSRVGWYNDSLYTGIDNGGTYDYDGGNGPLDRSVAAWVGQYAATSGETSQVGSGANGADAAGSSVLSEMQTMNGPDLLFRRYFIDHYNRWINDGNYNEISRRLGYRISLLQAVIPTSVTPGSAMTVTLTLQNRGFGKIYNRRPLEMVFVGSNGTFVSVMDADCRKKMPLGSSIVTSEFVFNAPAGLSIGVNYQVYLRLPDPSPSIAANVRYMIRLANPNMWQSNTGYNSLNATILAGASGPPTPTPTPTETTFVEDTNTDFLNPDRGWMFNYTSPSSIAGARAAGGTVVHSSLWDPTHGVDNMWRLDQHKDGSPIPAGKITQLHAWFNACRAAGVKTRVRFAYHGNPTTYVSDAPLSTILTHFTQLTPILQEHLDVITGMDIGMIGRWGEWNQSTNGFSDETSATAINLRRQVIDAAMNVMGPTRMVGIRYPLFAYQWLGNTFNLPSGDVPFSGSVQSRLGWKNDCIVSDSSDGGTYRSWLSSAADTQDRNTFAAMGDRAATSGETCSAYGAPNQWSGGAVAINHFTFMGGPDTLNRSYYEGIYNDWIATGHYNEISRRLGYRIALLEMNMPQAIAPGQQVTITFRMKNSGFGKVYNPRPIDLTFSGPGGDFTVRLTADARQDLPLAGQTVEMEYTFTAPSGMQADSTYAMGLSMPDASESLKNDVRYNIRLANVGIWDATSGRHSLGSISTGEVPDEPEEPEIPVPDPEVILGGVGSVSTSLVDYPKSPTVTAADWYVDPVNGNDNNNGTSVITPFRTIDRGLTAASSRGSSGTGVGTNGKMRILVRQGTINLSSRFLRSTGWTTGLEVWGYGTERPVLNGTNLGTGANGRAIYMTSSARREHWKGFEVINTKERTFMLEGQFCMIEDMYVHDGLGEVGYIANWNNGAANNLIQDVYAWDMGPDYQLPEGTNVPDGFVCTAQGGITTQNNAFVRCFMANAQDDGFDLYRGRYCSIIDCVSFFAGYRRNGQRVVGLDGNSGDGNGFKCGGGDSPAGNNTIKGNLSVGNAVQQISHNSSTNPNYYSYNTGVGGTYSIDASVNAATTVRYNIGYQAINGEYVGSAITSAGGNTGNTWNDPEIVNPQFFSVNTFDYSLATGSAARTRGPGGTPIGASDVALAVAKKGMELRG